MRQSPFLRIIEAGSVLLFFLQALRVLFSVLFGIIYDQVFAGSPTAWLPASILLALAALSAPVLAWRKPSRSWLALFAAIAALGRIALTVNQADVRLWGSLIVLAAGGLYLAGLLGGWRMAVLPGLIAALGAEQLLRLVGNTYDLSLQPGWLPIQVIWSLSVVGLTIWLNARGPRRKPTFYGLSGAGGLALGGILFLETSLLALPNAIARWSAWPYEYIGPALLAVTWVALIRPARQQISAMFYHRLPLRLGLAIFLSLAVLTGYFREGALSALALLLAQAACLAGLIYVVDNPVSRINSTGPRLALGLAALLLLNFFNAFAFTYPYSLPLMRGMGWAVYLAAGILVGAGIVERRRPLRVVEPAHPLPGWITPFAMLILIAVGVAAVWPRPASALPASGSLRVATYNMHYGYDAQWHYNLAEIAKTIEANEVDVVALQEVDTGRMTSYSSDDVIYLSRRLRMKAVYVPTVEHLTGIALLYRGPAEAVDWQLLPSRQEQTGIAYARLPAGSTGLNAFGIWMGLGNEDTLTQIRAALAFTGNRTPATFGGDFNAEPDSAVAQAVRQAGFIDPFTELGIDPPPLTDPAIRPDKRIDYVWLRGLRPRRAWVADSLASDHRMVVVEVKP